MNTKGLLSLNPKMVTVVHGSNFYKESETATPKILIVDDNLMLRETTRRILKSKFPAFRVLEAADGKEAFTQILNHLPDLILMDIRLPGENGLNLTRKIKDLYPKMAIIIFTNYDLPEYREAAFKNGADVFLSKSSPDLRKLNTVVESIMVGTTDADLNHQ
jgi:DNA-binding NarL/FixJ family response regulator